MEKWKERMDHSKWLSSYEENDYGPLFYALVRMLKPDKIVELGTKAGYSAFYMAQALRDNGSGTISCYDLWEKYAYTSCPLSIAKENLKEFSDIINFYQKDVSEVKPAEHVGILHVDLGNDAEIIDKVFSEWENKSDMIIVEGGAPERDRVEWMFKYNKKPMSPWLEEMSQKSKLKYFTFPKFPSLTLIYPKNSKLF